MKKVIVILFAVLFVLGAGLANATPKVAGLSNVGSVLIFPKIDTTASQETYVLLSNDNNLPVQIRCEWVVVGAPITPLPGCDRSEFTGLPPTQTGVDFEFTLTPFQPVIFAASTGIGSPANVTVNPFGAGNRGYLACWAVDLATGQDQISFNHLHGTAYVLGGNTNTTGYEYPAWAAQAENPAINSVVGTPGLINFNAVEYDALPNYLVFIFPTLNSLDNVLFFQDLDLTLIQGKQDFTTLHFVHEVTSAGFDTWNGNEVRFSGAQRCVWCFSEDFLDSVKTGSGTTFFTAVNLNSPVAKFRVSGKASQGCLPDLSIDEIENCFGVNTQLLTQATPLLGLMVQNIGPTISGGNPFPGTPTYVTTNLPVGVAQDLTGFIKWK